ncbi:hypothetical protein NDU88_005287 [Pleurodeles waltl]|uniref:Uncharacterized protein n=1 Tax=Pleurodeles waltl TaxID=8319 RepID=A0AAV7UIS6_PLEWA|nr:hypothetical protein NDU88_005287 [Pleurodeles waltl]
MLGCQSWPLQDNPGLDREARGVMEDCTVVQATAPLHQSALRSNPLVQKCWVSLLAQSAALPLIATSLTAAVATCIVICRPLPFLMAPLGPDCTLQGAVALQRSALMLSPVFLRPCRQVSPAIPTRPPSPSRPQAMQSSDISYSRYCVFK